MFRAHWQGKQMAGFPFVKSRPKARREGEPRRVRDREILRGQSKTERRWEIFVRSGGDRQTGLGGRCEAIRPSNAYGDTGIAVMVRCNAPITWDSMEWSHGRHAANKSDAFDKKDGIASCKECHRNTHNAGGKPVPKRPGRVMRMTEAIRYWQGQACFCDGVKLRESSFCVACKEKLSPQQRMDLDELKNADWLQTVALCELTILQSEAHQ